MLLASHHSLSRPVVSSPVQFSFNCDNMASCVILTQVVYHEARHPTIRDPLAHAITVSSARPPQRQSHLARATRRYGLHPAPRASSLSALMPRLVTTLLTPGRAVLAMRSRVRQVRNENYNVGDGEDCGGESRVTEEDESGDNEGESRQEINGDGADDFEASDEGGGDDGDEESEGGDRKPCL